MSNATGRRVTANLALTLDGRYNGPGGPGDLGAIVPYAVTDVGRDHLGRIRDGATTALLGRRNAEGFLGFWPPVADDENADPRDRGYAKWLVDVEKVVLSSTLTEAPWDRTRRRERPRRGRRRRPQGHRRGRHPRQQQPERHQGAPRGGPASTGCSS